MTTAATVPLVKDVLSIFKLRIGVAIMMSAVGGVCRKSALSNVCRPSGVSSHSGKW